MRRLRRFFLPFILPAALTAQITGAELSPRRAHLRAVDEASDTAIDGSPSRELQTLFLTMNLSPTHKPTELQTLLPIMNLSPTPTHEPTFYSFTSPSFTPSFQPMVSSSVSPSLSTYPTSSPSVSAAPFALFTYGESFYTDSDLDIQISVGLTVKRIAQTGSRVTYADGVQSNISYHAMMDGAGMALLPDGGYAYISNSEVGNNGGGVYGLTSTKTVRLPTTRLS